MALLPVILLAVGISAASCERSFSKLKLIKTYLRKSKDQDRISNEALLSTESDTLVEKDFDTVIKDFLVVNHQ